MGNGEVTAKAHWSSEGIPSLSGEQHGHLISEWVTQGDVMRVLGGSVGNWGTGGAWGSLGAHCHPPHRGHVVWPRGC